MEEALAVEGTATEQLKIVVERVARIIIENQRYITSICARKRAFCPKTRAASAICATRFDTKLAALLEKGKAAASSMSTHPSRTAIWVSGLLSWIALLVS